jgi:hypothetical protein
MPRGMTKCRICGKPIPSFYRQDHESRMCIAGRKLRGEYVSPQAIKAAKKAEREKWERLAEEQLNKPQQSINHFF